MAYNGTEEMARFSPNFNYTGGDHQNYLRQLNRFGDTDLGLIKERGEENARHELAYADRMGQAIGAGYHGFRQGKSDAYTSAQAEENLAQSRLNNQDAAAEMEAKNKIYDPTQAPGAMSGREFSQYDRGTQAANNQTLYGENKRKSAWSEEKGADGMTNFARGMDQDRRLTEEQIKNAGVNRQVALAGIQNQNFTLEDRKLSQAATVIRANAKDPKTGQINPVAAQSIAASFGLTPEQSKLAIAQAGQTDLQGKFMERMLDPGWTPFNERVERASGGAQDLQALIAEAKSYKEGAGMQGQLSDTTAQSQARERIAQMFEMRNKPEIARDIRSSVPSVGRGAWTADQKISMYLQDEIKDLETQINYLKGNQSYGQSPHVQNLVQELETMKKGMGQVAGTMAPKNVLNIFSPQQSSAQGMANASFFQQQPPSFMAQTPGQPQGQPGQQMPATFRRPTQGQQFANQPQQYQQPQQPQPQFAPGAFNNLPNMNRGGL